MLKSKKGKHLAPVLSTTASQKREKNINTACTTRHLHAVKLGTQSPKEFWTVKIDSKDSGISRVAGAAGRSGITGYPNIRAGDRPARNGDTRPPLGPINGSLLTSGPKKYVSCRMNCILCTVHYSMVSTHFRDSSSLGIRGDMG